MGRVLHRGQEGCSVQWSSLSTYIKQAPSRRHAYQQRATSQYRRTSFYRHNRWSVIHVRKRGVGMHESVYARQCLQGHAPLTKPLLYSRLPAEQLTPPHRTSNRTHFHRAAREQLVARRAKMPVNANSTAQDHWYHTEDYTAPILRLGRAMSNAAAETTR